MRMWTLLTLSLCGCAPAVLDLHAWNEAPPDAPCEVEILYHDGMGDSHRVARYDAEGRVLFGTTQLTYDGRGWERITWDGDHPIAFDAFYEQDEREDFCDDGCGEPASRRIDHVELTYRGDQVVEQRQVARTFGHDGDRWVERDRDHGHERYVYRAGRLVEIDAGLAAVSGTVNGTVKLEYDGDQVIRRRFQRFTSTFEWKDGRLAVDHWGSYVQTYQYDDAGRLSGEVIADQTPDGATTTLTWTYDDRGRLVRKVKDENVWTWSYDDEGRLVHASNGGTTTDLTYHGACPEDLAVPHPPDPLQLSGAAVCVTSPGYTYDSCGY